MTYSELLQKEPRPLFFAMVNSFFSCYGQSHFLALFSLALFQHYQITNTFFGSLYASATLISAFALPVLGPLIDRVDVRKYCLGITFGLALGLFLLLQTKSLFVLFSSIFLLRLCGQGLCTHVNGVCTARYFGLNRGKALSLTNIGFPLAEGLFTPLVAFLILQTNTEKTLTLLLCLLFLIYLPATYYTTRKIPLFNRPALQQEMADVHTSSVDWTPQQVLKHKIFYLLISHSIFPAFSLTGFLIYQTSYAASKHWPLQIIAFSMSLFAIGRLLSSFLTGPLVDKYGALKLFPYYQIPLSAAFFLMWLIDSPLVAYGGLFLCGLTVGSAAPIKSSLWAELYGVAHLGAIKSLFATIIVVVTSISPLLFGWMVDRKHELTFLLSLSVMSLITTCLGVWAILLYKKSRPLMNQDLNLSFKK
jgi:MFS family permease